MATKTARTVWMKEAVMQTVDWSRVTSTKRLPTLTSPAPGELPRVRVQVYSIMG